jgi:ABC-type sugar transport system ATPase subunit
MPTAAPPSPPLLRMEGIHKAFPGVHALRGVDLELRAGEVLALLGENGAGKSTLIKILGGAMTPDAGTIEVAGQPVSHHHPVAAHRAGISVIYQEFNLVPALTARENIFLGQEPGRFSFVPAQRERRRARELFARLGVVIDPEAACRSLSVAQQQLVEIAKALAIRSRIIVMDEPTAALSPNEVERLFAIVRELKSQGIGVIYISHRLSEVFAIADRVLVLRDGALVGTKLIGGLTRDAVIEMMVGRSLDSEFPKQRAAIGPPRLVVRNLRRGTRVRDVSLAVRRGEVLGLTGLVGAGRTETARLIFGADRRDGGDIELDGRQLRIRHPRQAIAAGICLLSEDRKSHGLVLSQTVQENFGLPNLAHFSRWGFIRGRRENTAFDRFVEKLQIRIAGRRQRTATLSGGNQQKVVLAKWLERNAEVVIFDEPTRGIDVGTKYEIYLLINRLAAQGKAILMISSELPEVLGMSDRICVMHEGRICGEITDVASATQEQIMDLAVK